MDYKVIDTGGIGFFEALGGGWYWGMDCTGGDLYEAEELFRDGHRITKNRLIFIRFPEGQLLEPVKAAEGQYLGSPVCCDCEVFCLLADFPARQLAILRCAADMRSAEPVVTLPLDAVPDCYNLMLRARPLTLVRQGHEGVFQVVWPDKASFPIEPSESVYARDGDTLIASRWFEDPDYREETVLRRYPTGEVLEQMPGTMMTAPDGSCWLLK